MREVQGLSDLTGGFRAFFGSAWRGLKTRLDRQPVDSVDHLAHFVETRSAYVAQTALYGYLKTRMGMKFRELFQDPTYSHSIRVSSEKLFLSCAADLSVFTVCAVAEATPLAPDRARELARHVYRQAVNEALKDSVDPDLVDQGFLDFDQRLAHAELRDTSAGADIFQRSIKDLIRFAPVIDEFKQLDREIVENSIRFRWIDIRQQVRKKLVPDAVATDWKGQGDD